MAKEEDRNPTFEKFMEGVNQLLVDRSLREVLREVDAREEETISLLTSDPAAFLRYRGIQIPEYFRVSVHQKSEEAAKGTTTTRYCLTVCAWRWCFTICLERTTKTSLE
jgi:hypothetical protein